MITEKKKAVIIFVWVCLTLNIVLIIYNTLKPQSLSVTNEMIDEEQPEGELDMFMINRAKEIAVNKNKIKHMKELIKEINEDQHISDVHKAKAAAFIKIAKLFEESKPFGPINLNNTVLVIQVHANYKYVGVLLQSLRKVMGISGSLLIFVHNYYSARVFTLINRFQFARTMQIYYPFSTQLHPYSYPGDDLKFCPEWHGCFYSNERADANLIQAKLFWWWTVNEIFDRIEVLKNYSGYIYFLEAESYLTADFIVMAKQLEFYLPYRCPKCRIISLAARRPRLEMYSRTNNDVFIGIWGRSNYSNSGIGFNRSTWNEIRALKEEFCNYNDYGWDASLRNLGSKTPDKHLYMFSTGGPRVFLTNDCVFGNVRTCDLNSTYIGIANFTRTISDKLFPYNHRLKFESLHDVDLDAEQAGGFEDVRDRELCMFFSSEGRQMYY